MPSKTTTMQSWACALSTLIVAGAARAQAQAPAPEAQAPASAWYPQQYAAHVSIQAAPATELEVVPAGAPPGSAAVARCSEYCEFWAWPGKYTLYSRDNNTGTRRELPLRIKQSSRYFFEPGDDDARSLGLGLAIGGSVAFFTGFVLVMPLILAQTCEDSRCTTQGKQDAATVGGALLLAGLIASPIGWGMYAHNRPRLKRIDDRAHRASKPTPEFRVGVVGVGLGGFGLGGVATF